MQSTHGRRVGRIARSLSFWHPCTSGVTLVQTSVDPVGDEASRLMLYRTMDSQLSELRQAHDMVLIDSPAGVEGPVRWSLDRADMAILLLVDEPTSVADAYRLVKSVWQQDPFYPIGAVANFAETDAHGRDVLHRFGAVTQRSPEMHHFTSAGYLFPSSSGNQWRANVPLCATTTSSRCRLKRSRPVSSSAASLLRPEYQAINKNAHLLTGMGITPAGTHLVKTSEALPGIRIAIENT